MEALHKSETDRCITVYDKHNKLLAPCSKKVAWVLINRKRAIEIGDNTIKILVDKQDLRKLKKKVIQRDKGICIYCGRLAITPTIDHVNPKTITDKGKCGYDTEENMVCSCLKCNKHKDNMSFNEYIKFRYATLIAIVYTIAKIEIN